MIFAGTQAYTNAPMNAPGQPLYTDANGNRYDQADVQGMTADQRWQLFDPAGYAKLSAPQTPAAPAAPTTFDQSLNQPPFTPPTLPFAQQISPFATPNTSGLPFPEAQQSQSAPPQQQTFPFTKQWPWSPWGQQESTQSNQPSVGLTAQNAIPALHEINSSLAPTGKGAGKGPTSLQGVQKALGMPGTSTPAAGTPSPGNLNGADATMPFDQRPANNSPLTMNTLLSNLMGSGLFQ